MNSPQKRLNYPWQFEENNKKTIVLWNGEKSHPLVDSYHKMFDWINGLKIKNSKTIVFSQQSTKYRKLCWFIGEDRNKKLFADWKTIDNSSANSMHSSKTFVSQKEK